jgi:hypothetical protein
VYCDAHVEVGAHNCKRLDLRRDINVAPAPKPPTLKKAPKASSALAQGQLPLNGMQAKKPRGI